MVEDRPLGQANTQAGVLSDEIIQPTAESVTMNHTPRLVMAGGPVHTSRGRRRGRKCSSTGPNCDGVMRLVADMLDVPAELIAPDRLQLSTFINVPSHVKIGVSLFALFAPAAGTEVKEVIILDADELAWFSTIELLRGPQIAILFRGRYANFYAFRSYPNPVRH